MLARTYPLTAWLAAGFVLLHTGLRAVLMAQTWHAAQLTFASAAAVLHTGLAVAALVFFALGVGVMAEW